MTGLNVCRFHLPYVEYNLFNNYIIENLCVQRNEANNCCQGHCFLEKQFDLVNDIDHNSGNPTENKQMNWNGTDDFIIEKVIFQDINPLVKRLMPFLVDTHITKMRKDVPSPPPKHFV
jgi:hypothetical protein